MDVLILLRHGKAVRDHEAPSDEARGLTGRGRREAAEAGAVMARERLIPDRILVSPALRTRETYEALAQTLAAKPTFSAALYMASPEAVWDAAVRSGGSTVLVIGHNPGLHELAAGLIAQAHDRSAAGRTLAEHLPTASLAAFSVTGERLDAAGPRLLAYWSPKD